MCFETTAYTFSTSQLPKVLRACCDLYIFWLGNVLRSTTPCTFATSWLPKVLRYSGFFCTFWDLETCFAPQRRAIFHLSSAHEPTCRPSGATNHLKNTVFRDFAAFSRTCIFFLLTLSLLWSSLFCSSLLLLFPPLLFHLSILSEVRLLNFLRLGESFETQVSAIFERKTNRVWNRKNSLLYDGFKFSIRGKHPKDKYLLMKKIPEALIICGERGDLVLGGTVYIIYRHTHIYIYIMYKIY